MSALGQDLRYGARVLLKNRRFTVVAVLTLALGIGVNTSIFSIIDAALIRPLPYPESERLVRCYWQWSNDANDDTPNVSVLEYDFWKQHSSSFQDVGAFGAVTSGMNLASGAQSERVRGLRVSQSFVRVLGVSPTLGRNFSQEEDYPNGPLVALISDGLWRTYFGGDRTIIGRQLQIDGRSRTVVGVLPHEFKFEVPVDVLIPLQMSVDSTGQGHNTAMLARLKQGVSLQRAQAEMDQLLPEFRRQFPNHTQPKERGIRLVRYQQHVIGDVGLTLWFLLAAAGLVLIVTCVNISNLMLARAAAREHEMAIRTAIGAGWWRLIRQLMTESVLLALVGGLAGLLFAAACMPALLSISPSESSQLNEIRIDYRTMLFTACAALLSSLLFGFLPALRLTRVSVNEKLKAAPGKGIAGGTPHRLMRGLPVVSQIALAFMLLVGSGLLVKSFIRLHQVQLGFEPQNLMTMQAALTSEKYRTADAAWEFQRRVLDRLATVPGVFSTATVSSLPMERGLNIFIRVTGSDAPGRQAEYRPISPDYFRTMGITALRGRTFTDDDMRSATPGVIVNQHLASLFWPTEDPLGHELSFDKRQWKIIGVASNIREKGLDKPLEPTVYVPMARISDEMTVSMNRWFLTSWLVRTAGPIDVGAQLRDAIREVDPQIPVANIRPMNEVVSASVASQRFVVFLMGIFAGSALFLTAVGLYGVLSYQVSQRRHEIGVRMALGARPRHVMKLIVGQGLLLAVIGICLGLAGSLAGTRIIANLLFGVSVTDPATYVSITVLLSVIALLDCYFPARRAMKVDPVSALRQE